MRHTQIEIKGEIIMATAISQINSSIRDQVSAEEWQVRVDLACAYRLVAHYGWDDLIFTHLSARVPGPEEHFLINPFGLMFDEITASSLVKIDLAGQKIMPSPYPINPAGFTIHGCIHAARHDVGAVMHTHTVAGIAVSAQKHGLLPLSQTELQFHNGLSYHDYEGIALIEAEKARLVTDLGHSNAMILRNHGLLTAGKTVGETFLMLFMLQKACEIQLAAQASGAELIYQSKEIADLVEKQVMNSFSMSAHMAWLPLLRKMDRLDESYRS
jgi:ribulose-5-phosphate 4-epimerase/fuculose-1-phosphate aldolase